MACSLRKCDTFDLRALCALFGIGGRPAGDLRVVFCKT